MNSTESKFRVPLTYRITRFQPISDWILMDVPGGGGKIWVWNRHGCRCVWRGGILWNTVPILSVEVTSDIYISRVEDWHCGGVKSYLLVKMDYKGQQLSEMMYYVIVILFGVTFVHLTWTVMWFYVVDDWWLPQVVAWIYGYLEKDFSLTVYGWMGGLGLAVIVSNIWYAA